MLLPLDSLPKHEADVSILFDACSSEPDLLGGWTTCATATIRPTSGGRNKLNGM